MVLDQKSTIEEVRLKEELVAAGSLLKVREQWGGRLTALAEFELLTIPEIEVRLCMSPTISPAQRKNEAQTE